MIAKEVSSTIELVNSETTETVNSFNFAMWVLPTSVFPLSWSHVLMDGEELEDK